MTYDIAHITAHIKYGTYQIQDSSLSKTQRLFDILLSISFDLLFFIPITVKHTASYLICASLSYQIRDRARPRARKRHRRPRPICCAQTGRRRAQYVACCCCAQTMNNQKKGEEAQERRISTRYVICHMCYVLCAMCYVLCATRRNEKKHKRCGSRTAQELCQSPISYHASHC